MTPTMNLNRSNQNARAGICSVARTLALACRATTLWACVVSGAPTQSSDPLKAPLLLTNAQQIADLGTNVVANHYEARFSAVVLYVSPPTRRLYVQEGDRGVQVNLAGSVASYRVGNLVEVSGTVLGGEPTLRIGKAMARVLGDAPLPEPKLVSVHRLVEGQDAFRYVKVRGMVRDMYSTRDNMTFLLTRDGYPFEVAFQTTNAPLPRDWTDAEIEVTGNCYPFYGANGRPRSIRFHAVGTNHVRVLTPGIADRFDGRPLLTIAEATKLPDSLKPRYRVAGTVTVARPGIAFFIDDGTGAMLVDTTMGYLRPPPGAEHLEREPQTWLQPGERVEVIGARHNWFSLTPSLMATEFRRRGHGKPVPPISVTLSDLQAGRFPGKLVTLTAQLVDFREWGTSSLRQYVDLVLRVENDIFQARWESEVPAKWDLQTDDYVRITGVNDAESGAKHKRSSFKILLRSPADVAAASAPPFWTRRDFQRIALAAGVVALLAGAWIGLQRVQVRRLEHRVAERTAEMARVAALANASEARTRAVVDTALDAVISMDAAGRITAWNARAETIFGWPAAEVLGRPLAETIIPPSRRDAHRRGLEHYLTSGEGPVLNRRVEITALRRDGREFPAELSIAPLQIDGAPHFSAFLRDITDRKLAEARLRESEERFSKAFHGSNARLAILDAADGRYLDVNEAFVQAYGYSREEILGRTSLEMGLWEDPAQRAEAYRIYQREECLRDFESVLRTRSGERQVVLQSGDFVSVGDRRCILSVGIDITDRKRVEAELLQNYAREKELNELKSRFVAMVSHEFRTPLAIITSSAEILDAYLDRLSPEERKSNTRDITDASRHMSRMMEEVLLLGGVEAGKMTCRPARLDLLVFGQRLADEVASATNGRCPIRFTAAPGLGDVQADEGLLRHIFTNLLNNASKYSPPGSAVEFQVEARGHLVIFSVRDSGVGIPETDARLLFQAFHRGRNVGDTPGTGLGMTIVKRCVELHGGKIAFESQEGHGTTFIVALPLFCPSAGDTHDHTTQFIRAAAGGRSLIFIP
jgi:PAS domain S-box-containing protein